MKRWLLMFSMALGAFAEGVPGVVNLRTQPAQAVVYELVDGQWDYVGWSDQALPLSDTLQPRLRFCYTGWVALLGKERAEKLMKESPESYQVGERVYSKAELERGVELPIGPGGWAFFAFLRGGWLLIPVLGGIGWALWRRQAAPKVPALQGGRKLGRFELEKSLGKGGFGEVFLALDDQGQPAAVKVLRSEVAEDESARKRFFREIEVLSRLRHPNIVHIYDWGESDGQAYLSMEYLEGESLGDLLARGGRLEEAAVARLFEHIGAALAELHSHELVHRDIKPDNIFVETSGRFKLMDFGTTVSDEMTRATKTGTTLGTPAYMAPEQVQGKLDPASDQYSLGVVAFLLLTGQRPFEAPDPMALAWAHVHTPPPVPSSLNAELSIRVDTVLLKMLAKQPAHRYVSVGEACAALLDALRSQALPEEGTMEFGAG